LAEYRANKSYSRPFETLMRLYLKLRLPLQSFVLATLLACGSSASALGPGPDDSGDKAAQAADKATQAADKAAQDLAKIADQSARDQQRYLDEKAKIQADSAKDPAKAQQDLAKLNADSQKWAAQRSEDTAKIEADLAQEEAKIQEDYGESDDRSGEAESSASMHDVGQSEAPDHDTRGFPVRRDEVAALDLDHAAVQKAVAEGFRVVETIPLEDLGRSLVRLAVPPGVSEEAAVQRIRALDPHAVVDLTHYYGMLPAGEEAEGTAPALARKRGDLRVGMIDTAVAAHPFLKPSSIRLRSFGGGAAGDPAGHGTAVASILVSEGARAVVAANVFRGGATAVPFTSADSIAAALEWLAEQRVPVVNISLAGPRNAILDTMIVRALRRGMTVVASAGNGGPAAPPAYPAALRNVVAVTAVDQSNRVYRYANQGPYIVVAAPGVREPGAAVAGGFRLFSGTSFAAPHIAAWFARCLDSRKSAKLADVARCRAQMIASATDVGAPGLDPVYGYGVIR
jgi:hypothetical protein